MSCSSSKSGANAAQFSRYTRAQMKMSPSLEIVARTERAGCQAMSTMLSLGPATTPRHNPYVISLRYRDTIQHTDADLAVSISEIGI